MTQTPSSKGFPSFQLINSDAQGATQHLSSHLQTWGMLSLGRDYRTISIVGSQSSGKSTILNALFKTSFDVMDDEDRKQTTKGIWLSRSDVGNILVMDVEGVDGSERGEDKSFERKSALFALASSEVLIFNIWHTQVGLSDGANMGLFKTVLEVNFDLFNAADTKTKTLLFFLIRDHNGKTPLSNLKQSLEKCVSHIWERLPGAKDHAFSDFFELKFAALPHREYRPDAFESAVKDLRMTFVDKQSEGYVFKTQFSKNVPADGLAKYLEGLWEIVRTNKHLDIPAQKELLAAYKCKVVADEVLKGFRTLDRLSSKLQILNSGNLVDGLGRLMEQWRAEASTRFEEGSSLYRESKAFELQLMELRKEANATLRTLFDLQISNRRKSIIQTFKKKLLEMMESSRWQFITKLPDNTQSEIAASALKECENVFKQTVGASKPGDVDWPSDRELETLRLEVAYCVAEAQAKVVQEEMEVTEKKLKETLQKMEEAKAKDRECDCVVM